MTFKQLEGLLNQIQTNPELQNDQILQEEEESKPPNEVDGIKRKSTKTSINPFLEANTLKKFKKVWDNAQVQKIFNEFTLDGSDEIPLQDYFLFLRELFEKTGFKMYEDENDGQSLFQKTGSYKQMFKKQVEYFEEQLPNFDQKTTNINKEQCYYFMEEYIKTSSIKIYSFQEDKNRKKAKKNMNNSMRRSQLQKEKEKEEVNERDRKYNKIRDKILNTIKEYEDMLDNAEDDSQKDILKATLKTLYK